MRTAVAWVSGLLTAVLVVSVSVFRFQHPDMSETRVFLETWPRIVLTFVSVVVCGWALETRRNR